MSGQARKPTRAKGLGVTDEQYAQRLAAQGGGCAICGTTPKTRRLNVDHDHATGAVRGLLCHRCNRALPNWITPRWLDRAWMYLNQTTESMASARLNALLPDLHPCPHCGTPTWGPACRAHVDLIHFGPYDDAMIAALEREDAPAAKGTEA